MQSSNDFLRYDDYIDARNRQEELIRDEFKSTRTSTERHVHGLEDSVKKLRTEVHAQFASLDKRVNETQLGYIRMFAYSKNTNLRHPALPLNPIPSYHPKRGIIQPDAKFFPRNAKDFYSLRNCTSSRQREKLAYLIQFYDLPYKTWCSDSASEDENPSESNDFANSDSPENDEPLENDSPDQNDDLDRHCPILNDAVTHHSALAVDYLEGILGLNEENFLKFAERAEILRLQKPGPTKRQHHRDLMESNDVPGTKRQANPMSLARPLEIRPHEHDAREQDDQSVSTKLEWDNTTKSPDINKTIRKIYYNNSPLSGTTNPFTVSPGQRSR